MRLMSKGEYVIVPKGTKFTGAGKLGVTKAPPPFLHQPPSVCERYLSTLYRAGGTQIWKWRTWIVFSTNFLEFG